MNYFKALGSIAILCIWANYFLSTKSSYIDTGDTNIASLYEELKEINDSTKCRKKISYDERVLDIKRYDGTLLFSSSSYVGDNRITQVFSDSNLSVVKVEINSKTFYLSFNLTSNLQTRECLVNGVVFNQLN